MPVIGTVNFPSSTDGKVVPVSVSRLGDGTYALIVDERSVHNIGIGGAAFVTANASVSPVPVTDASVATERLVIDELIISSDVAKVVVTFTEETTGTILMKVCLSTNQSLVLIGNDRIKLATPGKRLMVQTDVVANLWITPLWYSEP